MCTTVNPAKQALQEWSKIFPRTVTENYTSSVTFMKQLTVVAVSTITYLKGVFPEESYKTETFAGIKLKILKKKCRDDFAQFLSTALMQAFDAFEKKYLHQLALCFYEGECRRENLVEYHIFDYKYNTEGVTMNIHSKNRDSTERQTKYTFDNIQARTVDLIKTCMVALQASQDNLPSTCDVSLRLYYNEDAPEDYQAPGFSVSEDGEDYFGSSLEDSVKLGWVATPFHTLVARSYLKDNLRVSHEAIASDNPPTLTQWKETGSSESERSSMNLQLQCQCNQYSGVYAQAVELLTCKYCKTQQHAACYGFLQKDVSKVTLHCCIKCFDEDPSRTPTDERLASLNKVKRKGFCVFRQLLQMCLELSVIDGNLLLEKLNASQAMGAKLYKTLHALGIIQDAAFDLSTPKKILQVQLKNRIPEYFHTEENNIVNRLLAESFGSQEQSDPISDVLGPLQQISLHNTSNIGCVISPEDRRDISKPADEMTLNQYKEALMKIVNEEYEELPLSGSHNPVKNVEEIKDKKAVKRKSEDIEENKRSLRSGVKNKRFK